MLQEVLKHMPGELAAKEEHVREMDKLLQARKGLWKNERASMVGVYIQHCVLPRVTYSPADAAFCAAFMQRLITFRAPWFPVFIYYDVVGALEGSGDVKMSHECAVHESDICPLSLARL